MGTGVEVRRLRRSLRFGDLKLPFTFARRVVGLFGERGNVIYEGNAQEYAKHGKEGLWTLTRNARARERTPTFDPGHRAFGNVDAAEGSQCRAHSDVRSSDAIAEVLDYGSREHPHPKPEPGQSYSLPSAAHITNRERAR